MCSLRFIFTVSTILFSLHAIAEDCVDYWRCWSRPTTTEATTETPIESLLPPSVANDQLQYSINSMLEYAKKKQDCKDEITGCVYQLALSSGKPFLDAETVNACINGYAKCQGVHACDQNGEVISITPDPPKTINAQTPAPYVYGQMTCKKQLVVSSEGEQWYEYTIEAPTLCNPASNPANGPVNFSFQFNDKYKAKAALCEPTDPAQKGVTFNDLFPKSLNNYFTITTVGDMLYKQIAFCKSTSQTKCETESANAKDYLSTTFSLGAKTCMLSFPQSGGVPFAAGPFPDMPLNFPADYFIFDIYGYKVAIKQIAITNVDGFCANSSTSCTTYKGSKPNLCTVTLSVE